MHAVGQLAKIVTIVQVAFDLVVIGALISVASSRFAVVPARQRRRRSRPAGDGHDDGQEDEVGDADRRAGEATD